MLGLERWQLETVLIIAAGGSVTTLIALWLGWLALDSIAQARARRAARQQLARIAAQTFIPIPEDTHARSPRHDRRPAASSAPRTDAHARRA